LPEFPVKKETSSVSFFDMLLTPHKPYRFLDEIFPVNRFSLSPNNRTPFGGEREKYLLEVKKMIKKEYFKQLLAKIESFDDVIFISGTIKLEYPDRYVTYIL